MPKNRIIRIMIADVDKQNIQLGEYKPTIIGAFLHNNSLVIDVAQDLDSEQAHITYDADIIITRTFETFERPLHMEWIDTVMAYNEQTSNMKPRYIFAQINRREAGIND